MADKGLNDLFKDTLRDVYYAEKQVLKSLPKMERAAHAEEVKQAFRTHLKQTEGQIERLEKVFGMIDLTPRGKKCEAIDGILKEGDSVAEDCADTAALDAGLIAAAQAVEHYEITRYGTLRRWAKMLGMDEAASLLEQTLTEESETDDLLTQIADAGANKEALAEAKGGS